MLERIRESSQGTVAKVVLGVVVLSFAVAGVGSYLGNAANIPAAVVNGDKISRNEFSKVFENERRRMEGQFGEYFTQLAADPQYMATFRKGVLERMVAERLQDQFAAKLGLSIGEDQIKQTIRSMSEFQTEGKFDNDRYLSLLRQAGYTPESFANYLKVDMVRRQLAVAVAGSEFSLNNEVMSIAKLQNQTRDVNYAVLPAASFEAQVSVTPEQIEQYYQLNSNEFENPEQVSVEFVELNSKDLLSQVSATDDELKAYYDANQALYGDEEQRQAAHILVEFGDDEAAAKAKADAILAKVNANNFADVAKTDSSDTVSAENGGDLGFFGRGIMDPAFEQAVFALQPGQLSGVVKSSFGYHIIKLLAVKDATVKPFADVQAQIKEKLLAQKASEQFFNLQQKLTEMAFEVPDTLTEAATAVGKEVQSTALFTRAQGPAAFSQKAFLDAAFSDSVLVEHLNSDVVELAPEHVVVLRLKERVAATTKPLTEVTVAIEANLKRKAAAELAAKQAEELFAKLQSGTALTEVVAGTKAEVKTVAAMQRFDNTVPNALREQIFKAPHPETAPSVVKAELNNGDVALAVVTKVNTGAAEAEGLAARLSSSQAEQTYRLFIEALKSQAKIEYPASLE